MSRLQTSAPPLLAPAAVRSRRPRPPPLSQTDSGPPVLDLPSNGGSGSQTDTSLETPIEFCDAPTKVLTPKCGIGSCHGNQNAVMGDFGIDAEHALKFVDKPATRHPECGRIIDSRDYSQSLLLLKIRGDIKDPVLCGGIMPIPSFPPLSATQIDCVASWLQQFQR